MMEAVRAWLTSVVLVSVLLSAAQSLIPPGTVRKAAGFTGGLILLLVLLRPVLGADLEHLELDFDHYQAAVANEASEGIQVLAGYTMKEAQIENLVTAKGYTDCVAFMGEDSISVVVDTGTGELTAEDVAKITDIAMTETGYPASGIKIMASN